MNEELAAELLWVLVEGPGPSEAEFLSLWLLAAVEADRAVQEQFKQNPGLKRQMSRLEVAYLTSFSFSWAAMRFVELLMKNRACFMLALWDDWGEIFIVMAELGFFRLTGDRYQMTRARGVDRNTIWMRLWRGTPPEQAAAHPVHTYRRTSQGPRNLL
jgi:hypothetical protein